MDIENLKRIAQFNFGIFFQKSPLTPRCLGFNSNAALVHRFINSVTNLFTQDLVQSEQSLQFKGGGYVTVFANRST